MKICPFCRAENPVDGKHCTKCGTALEGVLPQSSPTPAQPVNLSVPPPLPRSMQMPPVSAPASPGATQTPPMVPPPPIPQEAPFTLSGEGRRYPGTVVAREILSEANAAAGNNRMALFGLHVVWFFLLMGTQLLNGIPILGSILAWLIIAPLNLGLVKTVLHFYDAGEINWNLLFSGFKATGRSIGLTLVGTVAVVVPTMLFALLMAFVVPGLMSAFKGGGGASSGAGIGSVIVMLLVVIPVAIFAVLVQIGIQMGYGVLADEPDIQFNPLVSRAASLIRENAGAALSLAGWVGLVGLAGMLVPIWGWIMWLPLATVMNAIFYRGIAERAMSRG